MSKIVFSGKESDKTISTIIKFWGTFTPQDRIELDDINNLKTYKDNLAILSNWLLVDVVEMLKDKNEEEQESEIAKVESWLKEDLGASLYQKLVAKGFSTDAIQERLAIRNDWRKTLNNVEYVEEYGGDYNTFPIASKLGFSLYESDLKELAMIHKNEEPGSKLQTVIENLLTDMNFHEDCGEFIAGYYDNYLSL